MGEIESRNVRSDHYTEQRCLGQSESLTHQAASSIIYAYCIFQEQRSELFKHRGPNLKHGRWSGQTPREYLLEQLWVMSLSDVWVTPVKGRK